MNGKIIAYKADGSIDEERINEIKEGFKKAELCFSYFKDGNVAMAASMSDISLEQAYRIGAGLSEKGLMKLEKDRKTL